MTASLQDCLAREHAQARAGLVLDDALGTHHGLSWADYVLLQHLRDQPEGLPEADLARRTGALRSRLLVRTRPLEKLGWLQRSEGPVRRVALSASGRRLLAEATETAERVCEAIRDPW